MNYIVFYTEGCSPKIKQFKSFVAAKRFANRHNLKDNGGTCDDWVDCIVKGKIVKTYPAWYDKPVKEK